MANKPFVQDDDLENITIITGTVTLGTESCDECGGEIPVGGDIIVTIGDSIRHVAPTTRARCTSCHIDQD